MNRPFASVGICLLLGACSVGMALGGTTLPGLNIVRLGASRGDVESEVGNGSSFYFTLKEWKLIENEQPAMEEAA